MNPSLAAVSAFGLRAPETFETAISAGARHMAQNGHLAGYRQVIIGVFEDVTRAYVFACSSGFFRVGRLVSRWISFQVGRM